MPWTRNVKHLVSNAVLLDRAWHLPTFSHWLIVNKLPPQQYAPAEKGSHQCVAEQVSARCTLCIPDPLYSRILRVASTTSESLHCRGQRQRDACTPFSSLVLLRSESSWLASRSSSLAFSEEVSPWNGAPCGRSLYALTQVSVLASSSWRTARL
jgi:hypothetical protein